MKRGGPLKRTTQLRNKTPMQRTGTLRTASVTKTNRLMTTGEVDAELAKVARKINRALKASRPKMTPIRRSARGEACTMLIPGICTGDTATTVLCHSNRLADGKGLGLKAPDTEACYGCSACHDVLDGRRPLPSWLTRAQLEQAFDRARATTQKKLKEKGLMT
jgi:hypothetical protein